MSDLETLAHQLQAVTCPEDLFTLPAPLSSALTADPDATLLQATRALRRTFAAFALVAHPDRYPQAPEQTQARTTYLQLNTWYEAAQRKLERGTFGNRSAPHTPDPTEHAYLVTTARSVYHIASGLAQGDLSTVYAGHRGDDICDRIVIKIADKSSSNEALQREVRVLRLLLGEASPQRKHLPQYLDQFKTDEGQLGIILSFVDGYDLHTIREKYPEGIDPQHVIWIFRRVLSVLGYAHSKGILHGNIDPAHILIRPYDHNVTVIDWTSSVENPANTGDDFKTHNALYSAPEVRRVSDPLERKCPLPSADLYSLGKCMLYALGGDLEHHTMPTLVDERLQRFIRFFLKPSPIQRAQDAWEMYHLLSKLRQEIYGDHQFRPFVMD